jgi:hypothetical protein
MSLLFLPVLGIEPQASHTLAGAVTELAHLKTFMQKYLFI